MRRLYPLLLTALVLLSCRAPFPQEEQPLRTGGLRVAVSDSIAARTAVPDVESAANRFDQFDVTLSSHDGFDTLTGSDTASPWSVSFPEVREGTWDIGVQVWRAGVVVDTGSVPDQLIQVDTTTDASVSVTFPNEGDMDLALSMPASTGIDYVSGDLVGTGLALLEPVVDTSGDPYTVSLTAYDLDQGNHTLVLTFRRGGALGTIGGIFREKVVVRGGFMTDAWVGAGGVLLAQRVFGADDFFDTNANLGGLILRFETGSTDLSGVVLPGVPHDLGPLSLNTRSVWITATESILGQYLRYSLNGGSPEDLRSTVESDEVTLQHDNTLDILVNAPDGQHTNTYTITFRLRELVTYHANGADSGMVPAPGVFYDVGDTVNVLDNTGVLVLADYGWSGWNEAANGLGTAHAPGTSFAMGSLPVTLYARWIPTHAVTVTFSIENPAYGVIEFSDPTPSVQWGDTIVFATSLVGGTDWHWYVNNLDMGVSTATFAWDTSDLVSAPRPGQYIINVDALYGGYPCTGSVLVTVYN